jgi:hypothetical protein
LEDVIKVVSLRKLDKKTYLPRNKENILNSTFLIQRIKSETKDEYEIEFTDVYTAFRKWDYKE